MSSASSPSSNQSAGAIIGRMVVYGILIIAAVYFLIPLFVMMITSIKTMADIRTGNLISLPREVTLDAWKTAWNSACIGVACNGIKGYFWNSVRMVIPAVAISTILGAINGYVFSKWRFKGSEVFFSLLLVGCFIPFQVILLPMARTLGQFGISQSLVGLIFVHVVYGLAFTTLFFRNFYVSIPDELVKAARIDGAGFFRIFWRILLPLSKPIFVVCIIWQTTQIWNDFLFGVVFSTGDTQPITVALNNLVNTSTGVKEYNVDMAAAIIAAIPTLLVYIVAGKYFLRGLTAGAVKG
ncbi:MAG: carbohydrate ABC transporter permease [Desulfobacterales bacterium]|nr:carbohydrate ABC transporter permease [Desulfobacterales bacterium]